MSKYRIRCARRYSTAGTKRFLRNELGHASADCCFNQSSWPLNVNSSKAAAPSVESRNEILFNGYFGQIQGKLQAQQLLALLAHYQRVDVLKALERAVRFGAFSLAAIDRKSTRLNSSHL